MASCRTNCRCHSPVVLSWTHSVLLRVLAHRTHRDQKVQPQFSANTVILRCGFFSSCTADNVPPSGERSPGKVKGGAFDVLISPLCSTLTRRQRQHAHLPVSSNPVVMAWAPSVVLSLSKIRISLVLIRGVRLYNCGHNWCNVPHRRQMSSAIGGLNWRCCRRLQTNPSGLLRGTCPAIHAEVS